LFRRLSVKSAVRFCNYSIGRMQYDRPFSDSYAVVFLDSRNRLHFIYLPVTSSRTGSNTSASESRMPSWSQVIVPQPNASPIYITTMTSLQVLFPWRQLSNMFQVHVTCISEKNAQTLKLRNSKPTQKLKHANSVLESFEYFCQMSSKLIVIMLSYTVSKFARFFPRHSVV